MKQATESFVQDLGNFVRGLLMGAADVIPGVSGGTVALIVGIYERLVTAISRFDMTLLKLLRSADFGAAVRHLDLRFLFALGAGIGAGIVALGGVMNELLAGASTRGPTLAAFFGMILASTWIVARKIDVKATAQMVTAVLLAVAGAAFAWWLTTLQETAVVPSLPYLFLCGMVGICAMILPGISGAYILLILGTYAYMTSILKALPRGQITADSLLAVAVFAAGCAVGLLSFSKLLRWLLARLHWQTMAILCGFMIGALRKIWPFQRDLTPEIVELKHKVFVNETPSVFDGKVLLVVTIVLVAAVAVFALDQIGRLKGGISGGQCGGEEST